MYTVPFQSVPISDSTSSLAIHRREGSSAQHNTTTKRSAHHGAQLGTYLLSCRPSSTNLFLISSFPHFPISSISLTSSNTRASTICLIRRDRANDQFLLNLTKLPRKPLLLRMDFIDEPLPTPLPPTFYHLLLRRIPLHLKQDFRLSLRASTLRTTLPVHMVLPAVRQRI